VLGGTAGRSAISCPTAAKTGTTSNLIDAWLDGYTPNYSTVVWMGYPTKRVEMTDVHGVPQQGGYLPAEIWHAYMAAVTEGEPCTEFPTSKEAIVYKPFYGKFATTGLQAGQEEAEKGAKHSKHGKHSKPEATTPNESATGPPPSRAPTGPGTTPGAGGPTIRKTGGAAPG
jgi:membrane peptidoglycan carboxypeptidase